jgi:site-specific recombinase XerD
MLSAFVARGPDISDGLQSTLANSTIVKKFAALRRIYRMLVAADIGITRNPFDSDNVALPSKHSGEKRPTAMIPFNEVEKILAAPGLESPKARRDSAILALLFGCGLRRSEICSIRLGDLRTSVAGTPFVHLRNTKGKRDADQPVPEWAVTLVERVAKDRAESGAQPGDHLFISYRGRAGQAATNKPISSGGLYELFKTYCGLAGVSVDAAPHAARATAITKLLSDGFSHREVQEFSRHASVQMVEVYDKRHFGVDKNPGKKIKF